MTTSVLVAYATSYGSTPEVAQVIVTELRKCGLSADMQCTKDVQSLAKYHAVILGAPLIMFHWHKDAHRFLVRHQKALLERHLAIFALGPVRDPHDEQEWQASRDQLGKELAIYPWLKPLDLEMFGGKYDPTKLGFPLKLFAGKAPATDIRDWNAVRAWAKEMAAQLDEEHVEFPLR